MIDAKERLEVTAGTVGAILFYGSVGAGIGYAFAKPSKRAKHQKTGALIGATASGALAGMFFGAPPFCGLMSPKSEQNEIDRIQRPLRASMALGTAAAALIGGTLGSKVSKAHPTIGAVVGAALSGGAVILAGATACPTLPQSGVGQLRAEWGI